MAKILTFGVFDYFHLGHLRLFKQCKQHADYLIVGVQNGDYILSVKPDSKIMYSTEERVEILENIKIVDEIFVYNILSPDLLSTVNFDILALGEDHNGPRFDVLAEWCNRNGKSVVRLKRTVGICSSLIKEDFIGKDVPKDIDVFPDD